MHDHRHHMNTPIAAAVKEVFDVRNSRRAISNPIPKEENIPPNPNTLPVAIHIDRVLSDMPKNRFH